MDASLIVTIAGFALTLLTLAVGLGRVLSLLGEHGRRLDGIDARLDRIDGDLAGLREQLAVLATKVDLHINDERAHLPVGG